MIRKVTSVVAHVVHGVLTGSYRYTTLRDTTRTDDQITLPVSGNRPIGGLGGPFGQHDVRGDVTLGCIP